LLESFLETYSASIIALIGVISSLFVISKGLAEVTSLKKTRQAQLFMQIYDHMNDKTFQRAKIWLTQETGHLAIDSEEWRYTQAQSANPDAWAGFQALASYFGGIGVLVHRGLTRVKLVQTTLRTG
jgi:hypothetical protein